MLEYACERPKNVLVPTSLSHHASCPVARSLNTSSFKSFHSYSFSVVSTTPPSGNCPFGFFSFENTKNPLKIQKPPKPETSKPVLFRRNLINKCSRKTSPNVANNYTNVISRVLGFSKTPKIEKTVKNRKPNGQFPDVVY